MCITSFSSALTSILVSSCLEVAPDGESVHPPFRLTALVSVEKVGVPASAAQIIFFTEASVLLTSQSAASHDSTDLTFFLLLLYIIFQNARNTFFLWCTETLLAFYILLLFVTLKQKGEKIHVFVFRVASPVAPMSKILLLFSPITDKKSQVSQCQHSLNNH